VRGSTHAWYPIASRASLIYRRTGNLRSRTPVARPQKDRKQIPRSEVDDALAIAEQVDVLNYLGGADPLCPSAASTRRHRVTAQRGGYQVAPTCWQTCGFYQGGPQADHGKDTMSIEETTASTNSRGPPPEPRPSARSPGWRGKSTGKMRRLIPVVLVMGIMASGAAGAWYWWQQQKLALPAGTMRRTGRVG
jgi:hypothetical protein